MIIVAFFALIVLMFILTYQRLEKFQHEDYRIAKSRIAGKGVFVNVDKRAGSVLFPVIAENKLITTLGSKINHCSRPNTVLRRADKEGWWVESLRDIAIGEELTVDYRTAPSFVKPPKSNWLC